MLMRRFRRVSANRIQLRLPHAEKALLASVVSQLRAVVDGGDEVEHLRQRLFPPAYADAERERQFRQMIGDELVDQRRGAVDTVMATLDAGVTRSRSWSVELDPEQAQSWLTVLHDLRLVLGQIVGITTEDDWELRGTSTDPAHVVLWHAGALQEELLSVLMGGLAEA